MAAGMFFNFVDELRAAGIPASFKEHLTLLEALDKDVIEQTPEAFYYLSRATFVTDEGLLDRFDSLILVAPAVFHFVWYFGGFGLQQPICIFSGARS